MDELASPALPNKLLLDQNMQIWNEGSGIEVQKKKKQLSP